MSRDRDEREGITATAARAGAACASRGDLQVRPWRRAAETVGDQRVSAATASECPVAAAAAGRLDRPAAPDAVVRAGLCARGGRATRPAVAAGPCSAGSADRARRGVAIERFGASRRRAARSAGPSRSARGAAGPALGRRMPGPLLVAVASALPPAPPFPGEPTGPPSEPPPAPPVPPKA